MIARNVLASCLAMALPAVVATNPQVVDSKRQITYTGIQRNGIDVFLNIPYGQDTGGNNRFKPPKLHVPSPGTEIMATEYGPGCPQALGTFLLPLTLTNVTEVSENCLNLNIARPKGTCAGNGLPVMVFIHGGSFWGGSNEEITYAPDGMILESEKNGLPVIHVAMNYRLGFFGFAQSDALRGEGSENAGLRDQRLAIEWVRDNIEQFGGDPEKITIFGQSSGGLAVGLHMMAYGGDKPVPFQQAICQSQALEPGITGNFTRDAMQALVDEVGCDSTDLQSPQTVQCLRGLDMQTLLDASIATYKSDIAHNIGDIWLPVVDGDFLPAAPSQLVRESRFAKDVTAMMGWCENDLTYFSDTSIKTAEDTLDFISMYAGGVSQQNIQQLLDMYSVTEFTAAPGKDGLSAEFYRASRIFRDILMVCEPLWYGEHLASAGNTVYFYNWNQTILEPSLEAVANKTGFGPVHTAEFAYIFGNLSHYDTNGYPFHPSRSDYKLRDRGSRSWTTFAGTGKPGVCGKDTFQGFGPAFHSRPDDPAVFVAGGAHEGLSAVDGPRSHEAVRRQKLRERCAFINSPEMIEQLGF